MHETGRTKRFWLFYARVNFKDRRSLSRCDLLLCEDDPFPLSFALLFPFTLTHPSTGIAYSRYKVSHRRNAPRELHPYAVLLLRFFAWICFCPSQINSFHTSSVVNLINLFRREFSFTIHIFQQWLWSIFALNFKQLGNILILYTINYEPYISLSNYQV